MLTCVCRPVSSSFIEKQSIMGAPIDRDQIVVTSEPKTKVGTAKPIINQNPQVFRDKPHDCWLLKFPFEFKAFISTACSFDNLFSSTNISRCEKTLKINQFRSLAISSSHELVFTHRFLTSNMTWWKLRVGNSHARLDVSFGNHPLMEMCLWWENVPRSKVQLTCCSSLERRRDGAFRPSRVPLWI